LIVYEESFGLDLLIYLVDGLFLAGILVVVKYEFVFGYYFFPFFVGYVVFEIVFIRFFKATVAECVIFVFDENHFAFTVFFCAGEFLFNHSFILFSNICDTGK
jgi:hypothetical protein